MRPAAAQRPPGLLEDPHHPSGRRLVAAARSAIWDQRFVLSLVVVLAGAGLLLGRSDRPVVSLRVDLARLLRDRSAVEGEPVDVLLERTVATARRDHVTDDGRG